MNFKNILAIFFLISAAAIGYWFALPLYNSLQAVNAEVEAEKAKEQELISFLSQVNQFKEKYNTIKDSADKILEALPAEEDIPQLLMQFKSLATTNGLNLLDINFKESDNSGSGQESSENPEGETAPSYNFTTIGIKTSGTYEALKNYLKTVEENIRLTDATNITFSASTEGKNQNIFNYQLNFNVYYKKK